MKYEQLKRYVELDEQIKKLSKEMAGLKESINMEFKYDEGRSIAGGISYGTTLCTRTNTDLEALTVEIGVETVSKFQSVSTYTKVWVKPTSEAL